MSRQPKATTAGATAVDPPVYDERGNVRPRGTEGAVPMTYDERVALSEKVREDQA